MASRRDYKAVADGIREALEMSGRSLAGKAGVDAVALAARLTAGKLKDANANFRFDHFFEACGLDSWGYPKERTR